MLAQLTHASWTYSRKIEDRECLTHRANFGCDPRLPDCGGHLRFDVLYEFCVECHVSSFPPTVEAQLTQSTVFIKNLM